MSQPQQPKAAPTPTNNIDNSLDEILDEYENGQNPMQSEEYRLNKAKAAINKTIMESLPKKKNLAYRQGRGLPVLSGIEQRDPDHIKAKKYINHGYNQAISDMEQAITKKYGRADNE